MALAEGGNVKVVVRVRPFSSRELDRNAQCVVRMHGKQTFISPSATDRRARESRAASQGSRTFAFDKSYWSFDRDGDQYAGQEQLFEDLGKPLLQNAFLGYNAAIFAYGQTGSGKSYSMMGYGSDPGVIPRICKDMFDRIALLQLDNHVKCRVEVSYLEIYNERVRDLLNPSTKGNLKVREHPSTGPYVEDLAKLVVRSFEEIEMLMDEGNKARTVAATAMNETSSRSHAIFTLILTQVSHDDETTMDMERASKISLVDLAGSERASSSGATGARLKEGSEINRSLSTLGRVIAALADLSTGRKKSMSMVPYRDSVLTWLLKDSLGGNSMTAMIAAISPADINYEETLSTLRYADSAKRIKNHAVVNEDANARMIRELKEELAQLRSKLGRGSIQDGTGFETAQYPPNTSLDQHMVSIEHSDGTFIQVSKSDITEQLSQSEKLYQDLNQTWEQKLQKTEEIQKERETALEELGISIEKGFIGLSTPKRMPHLVNLSDDPLLAECLVYNLKPGTTTVGNNELHSKAEIRLNGSRVLKHHCTFENIDGIVTLVTQGNATVMVNGRHIAHAKRLRSGDRVILGDCHIFRFNHPQEARAERDEHRHGSRLSQAFNADEVGSPLAYKSVSKVADSQDPQLAGDVASPGPPTHSREHEHDYDWSFAIREAADAMLKHDQQIENLSDGDLDVLFHNLQNVRANRRSRTLGLALDQTEDSDSITSSTKWEKHLSAVTMDGSSIDTALTAPSTPSRGNGNDHVRDAHSNDGVFQHEQQSDSLGSPTKPLELALNEFANSDSASSLPRDHRTETQGPSLCSEKVSVQALAERQLPLSTRGSQKGLQRGQAKWVLEKMRQRKYLRMALLMLQHASALKEAQILSQQAGQSVVFQFAVVDQDLTAGSSYDMVLMGVLDEDDEELAACPKPCLAIRLIDFKHESIYRWPLSKLRKRLVSMRQMQQYLDKPEYLQHFRLQDPFSQACIPEFSSIGDAQVSLAAVFESRVQDFSVDVISPYTFSVLGILKLSVEPSLADAPASMLRFNVILHEMTGFPEAEGSSLHAQLFVPRVSVEGGVTTSQLIEGFNASPARFESVHSMSLASSSSRNSYLRISLFAKITTTHLDKMLSWDDMRDAAHSRRREHQDGGVSKDDDVVDEQHDVFARVHILELSEDGQYEPVDVAQKDNLDVGTFQIHQGLQRRIVLDMKHTRSHSFQWHKVTSVKIGKVRLINGETDGPGAQCSQVEVSLKLVADPVMTDNQDGTTTVKLIGQWDSSAHDSALINRTTSGKCRVQLSLIWDMVCLGLIEPLIFSLDIAMQVRPRNWVSQQSILSQLWGPSSAARSIAGIFSVDIKTDTLGNVMDPRRLDSDYTYVKGEETLNGWAPRGVSLIHDYIENKRRQARTHEIEAVKSAFGRQKLVVNRQMYARQEDCLDRRQQAIVARVIQLWTASKKEQSGADSILATRHDRPSENVSTSISEPIVRASASVQFQPKNPLLLKSGQLLMPDATQSRWVRHGLELRLPYLHVHSVPDGEGLSAINLRDSRIDHEPELPKSLRSLGRSSHALHIFAIHVRNASYLFASRRERDKLEWILKIDEAYTTGGLVSACS